MRISSLLPAVILTVLAPALSADVGMIDRSICSLVEYQSRADIEERELDVEFGLSHLEAMKAIFEMADKLWKEELIERIRYLAFKYENDIATIDLERRRLLLERHKAERDVYAAFCSSSGEREARIEEAQRRYEQTDCQRLGKDQAIAELDLAYLKEVLLSVQDLRENNVATLDAVIRAELDVEQAGQRLENYSMRVRACTDSGAAAGKSKP